MGVYINPPTESKEDFLERNGVAIAPPAWEDVPADSKAVVLVYNSAFTAAAVAYSEAELRAFSDPTDLRPKQWFLVKTEKLWKVSNLAQYLPAGDQHER